MTEKTPKDAGKKAAAKPTAKPEEKPKMPVAKKPAAKPEKKPAGEGKETKPVVKKSGKPAEKPVKADAKKPAKGKPVERKTRAFATGKRKKAVARASIKPGKGVITVNGQALETTGNEIMRMLMQEPLVLAGDAWKRFNLKVNVRGGGMMGQAQAVRQAVAKCLVEVLGEDMKRQFLGYDRNMLVYDPRRTEPHKPPRSSQGPRRYKQRSKR